MATIKSAFIFIIGLFVALSAGWAAQVATTTDNLLLGALCAFYLIACVFGVSKAIFQGDNNG